MSHQPRIAGWREWVALPELGIPAVEAKLDTGTRTSVLHAFDIENHIVDGRERVSFRVHPLRENDRIELRVSADVVDERIIVSSNGQEELRIVIRTPLALGGLTWPVEVTLTDRRLMKYRMLLGREALAGRVVVNSLETHLLGKPPNVQALYR